MSTAIKAFDEGDATQSIQSRAEERNPLEFGWGAYPLGNLWGLGGIRAADDAPSWDDPRCDPWLRSVYPASTVFAGVVYQESARLANTEWVLNSKDEGKLKKFQEMFATCDFGNGFSTFLKTVAIDLLTQNNGAFIEVIGKGGDRRTETPLAKEDIGGFAHLDAGQCYRTFDPEHPVIYVNPYSPATYHIMHWTRVITMSQFPQPYELGRGRGLCALYRSYEAGRMVLATNTYLYEKVTGSSPDLYVSNIAWKNMQTALLSAQLKNEAKQFTTYRDPIIISPLSGGVGAPETKIDKISLKSMPDGFSHEEELKLAMYMIAIGFGVDAREYWAATTTGATKADAEVQDLKAESKGIVDLMNLVGEKLNWRILPDDVTFEFRNRNAMTDKRDAENRMIRASTRSTQILSGELSIEEARLMAAEENDIKPEFLENQTSADDTEAVADDSQSMQVDEATSDTAQETIEESKAYQSTRERFITKMRVLVQQMRLGIMDAGDFIHDASDTLQTLGTRSFIEGVQDGGAPQISSLGQLEIDERRTMQRLINDQVGFLSNLSQTFAGNETTAKQLVDRVNLWANKGLDSIYYGGVMAGSGNPAMEWHIGKTEAHCIDCAAYEGRVYRKKIWDKYDIAPRSIALKCGGFRCDCSLQKTDNPITPGRPPKPHGLLASKWHRIASVNQ